MGSFNASKEPLFVIDGVPVTSGSLSGGSADAAYMNNSKTNIMSTLNPSDIENITVIKDAAAASLYGSRHELASQQVGFLHISVALQSGYTKIYLVKPNRTTPITESRTQCRMTYIKST